MAHGGTLTAGLAGLLALGAAQSVRAAVLPIGAGCALDDDCGSAELFCFPEEGLAFFTSGPPGGLCTALCEVDEDCTPLQAGSLCIPLCENDELCAGFCMEGCERNSYFGDELDPGKCHGRDEVACLATACLDPGCLTTLDACVPFCQSNDQCTTGSFCNAGNCQPDPPEGDPPGSTCDFSASESSCRGRCDLDLEQLLTYETLTGICVEPCILGTRSGCESSEQSSQRRACLGRFEAYAQGSGTGDLGACVTLCNCTSECAEGEVCDPIDLDGRYEALGVCARAPAIPDAPDCLSGSGGESSSTPGCVNGPVRACKVGDCLGTSECLADGTYGECRCLDDQGQAGGAAGEAADAPNEQQTRGRSGCHLGKTPGSEWLAFVLVSLACAMRLRRRSVRP